VNKKKRDGPDVETSETLPVDTPAIKRNGRVITERKHDHAIQPSVQAGGFDEICIHSEEYASRQAKQNHTLTPAVTS
jgi:hypothetical protein